MACRTGRKAIQTAEDNLCHGISKQDLVSNMIPDKESNPLFLNIQWDGSFIILGNCIGIAAKW